MSTWGSRIKSRMKALEMTQEELASKMGITRGAVTHYLAGRRVPPLRQFQKLAAVLKADPAWLQFGTTSPTHKSESAKSKKQDSSYPIPLLTWEQAAEFVDATQLHHAEIKSALPNLFSNKPYWYALPIQGDAMTTPLGNSRSFHEGDVIIIDASKTAQHGNYVIALLPRAKQATFKQFVIDGDVHYLKPLNPQYPITQIDDSTHICGVVVRCISLFE